MDNAELIAQQAQFIKELTSVKDKEKWLYNLAVERAEKRPESAWVYKKHVIKGRMEGILLALRLAENLLYQSGQQQKKPVSIDAAIKIAIEELRSIDHIDEASNLAEVDQSIDKALSSLLSAYETTVRGGETSVGRSNDLSNV